MGQHMGIVDRVVKVVFVWACTIAMFAIISGGSSSGADLPEINKRGVLRHLGVPYANFVTGSGDGLDVELVTLFAQHLGVKYEYVKATVDVRKELLQVYRDYVQVAEFAYSPH